MSDEFPVLYSFRRCPYAMRARLAIAISGVQLELREIKLSHKAPEFVAVSPKATVPVLQLAGGRVIDESLDIMHWALCFNDPENWLVPALEQQTSLLIKHNDEVFKKHLDHYKYADRYPQHDAGYYRQQGEEFILQLENLLTQNRYLLGEHMSLADAAILPFIRQFAGVDGSYFAASPFPRVRKWLNEWLESTLFKTVMARYEFWQNGDEVLYFPR